MIRKPNTVAAIRRALDALERELAALAAVSPPAKARKLLQASDLLTEARSCDLYRLR